MRTLPFLLSFSLLPLIACDKDPLLQDLDGDGFIGADDCDDADALVNPAASELCNEIDDNCDGTIDEGVTLTFYEDADGDSFGGETVIEACALPEGATVESDDCDDADPEQNPSAEESCNDEDDDCDGTIDEDALDFKTFYADTDGDGYGDVNTTLESCSTPSGYTDNPDDCDDGLDTTYPGADERCNGRDDDCDGDIDESDAIDAPTWWADTDTDGYGDPDASIVQCEAPSDYVDNDGDCNDDEVLAYTGADELCYDAVDNDCDGTVDNDDAVDALTWYADSDKDGYGNAAYTTTACEQPTGYVDNTDDCDDTEALAYTGADEVCDDVDNDCDGTVDNDDAIDADTWYADTDTDGYGDGDTSKTACEQPSGYVENADDCNDDEILAYTGADEVCDDVDNDCDGTVDNDDALDADTWYEDFDGDTFGDADVSKTACDQPSGYVANDEDCDDVEKAINPDADEVCDDADNDCDGTVDNDDAIDATTWHEDADEDGYGDPDVSKTQCDAPTGYVDNDNDCDDTEELAYTGADEVCDKVDNDCDGTVDNDDAIDADTWYADKDGDGYGNPSATTTACSQPSGYVDNANDCDDTEKLAYTGADEVCDKIDNDCDGTVDNDDALDAKTWYADSDGDGFGDPDDSTTSCESPSDYVADASDCDDDKTAVNPDATEICDGIDNDCEATTSEAGMVSFVDSSGKTSDLTSRLSGTSTAPADVTISSDGDLVFCDGTFYVNLDIEGDVDIEPLSSSTSVTLDGGASGSVIDIPSDGLSVSVSGMIIQNGDGDSSCLGGSSSSCGGGIGCSGDSTTTLLIDSVGFRTNDATVGGGLSSQGCSIRMTDSTFKGGSATFGGGFWVEDGTLAMSDTNIYDNTASYGAGFANYRYSASNTPKVSMEGSMVFDNTASAYGGGAWLYGSTTTCDGSTADAGFVANTATDGGGGIYFADTAMSFEATQCDFGAPGGTDDNDPFDILAAYGTDHDYWADDDATFTCESGRCGTLGDYTIGGTATYVAVSTQLYGNIVDADTVRTLDTFSMYLLASSSSCTADFYVMSNTSDTETGWAVEWASTGTSIPTTAGYVESDEIGLAVEDGLYYMLSVGTTCTSSVRYYYQISSGNTDAGFGSSNSYGFDSTYASTLAVGDTYDLIGRYGGYDAIFAQEVSVYELD